MRLLEKIKKGCKNFAHLAVKTSIGEKKCFSCKQEFRGPLERNFIVEIILFCTTWWMLWIPLIIYYIAIPKYRCPNCKVRLSTIWGGYRKEQGEMIIKQVKEEHPE